MPSPGKKKQVAKQIIEVFIREGKVLSSTDWAALEDKPMNAAIIRKYLGSWGRMQARAKSAHPDLWALIGTEEGENYKSDAKVNSTLVKKPTLKEKIIDAIKPLTSAEKAAKKAKEAEDQVAAALKALKEDAESAQTQE